MHQSDSKILHESKWYRAQMQENQVVPVENMPDSATSTVPGNRLVMLSGRHHCEEGHTLYIC